MTPIASGVTATPLRAPTVRRLMGQAGGRVVAGGDGKAVRRALEAHHAPRGDLSRWIADG